MSEPKPQPPYVALIVCATIVALALIGALVALIVFAPPGADLVKILGAVSGGLALVVTQVANYIKTRSVATTVDDLANGKMDAKIRAGVADVVKPDLIDAGAHEQLEADRSRRATT